MFLIPMAIKIANARTGRPVPIAYVAGKMILELFFKARGIKLPKKSAAEIGQKERAKSIPKSTLPTAPRFLNRLTNLSEEDNPRKVN